jgi:hypothetical protein
MLLAVKHSAKKPKTVCHTSVGFINCPVNSSAANTSRFLIHWCGRIACTRATLTLIGFATVRVWLI